MINRRHIRVKVMQSVYAMLQSKNDDLLKEEKFLKLSILKMFDLYVLNIHLMVKVQELASKKIELSKKKILATKEDLKPNTKFIDNRILNTIKESVSIDSYIHVNKLNNWELDDEYVKLVFDELQKSDLYKNYLDTVENSFKVDKAFVIDFFKEIIAPNEKLAEYFEDKMISWVDDIPFVNTWVVKTLSKQKENNSFMLGVLYKDKEDEDFVSNLFKKTMLHQHKFEEEIAQKTPNWETDRIADIDMILIKMAITEFTNGYNTILGERGVTLSGGQKQRVSIARAIIKNPKILIFDDCLSAVDTETEEKILNNLEKVSKNKTTFIISHRVSSAKNADKIIVLDDAKIIQQGTHNQLITENGYYKELYEQQLLEKEF